MSVKSEASSEDGPKIGDWPETLGMFPGVAVAARAALRVLPIAFGDDEARALIGFRCCVATLAVAAGSDFDGELARAAYSASIAGPPGRSDVSTEAAFEALRAAAQCAGAAAGGRAADARRCALEAFRYAAEACAGQSEKTHRTFLSAVQSDVATLKQRGPGSEALLSMPLWRSGAPGRIAAAWSTAKGRLLAADTGWVVWTDWYTQQRDGSLVEPANERSWATLPEELWSEGPAQVNARLLTTIEQRHEGDQEEVEGAEVPERPAPVHFEMRSGVLHSIYHTTSEELPAALASARLGLIALIDDLGDIGVGRQHPRLMALTARIRDALGDDESTLDAVLLGVLAGRFSALVARADEIFLPEDAAELVAMDIEIGRYVAHFPEWRSYVESVAEPFAEPQVEQAAVTDAARAMDAIERANPEIFTPAAAEALQTLHEGAEAERNVTDPHPVATPLQRRSYLRAVRSALRAIAHAALQPMRRGAGKAFEKISEVATLSVAGAGGVAALSALATRLPNEFGWLRVAMNAIAKLLGLT